MWSLIPAPEDQSIIGTKWVFKNKLDEQGNVVRNKASVIYYKYIFVNTLKYFINIVPVHYTFHTLVYIITTGSTIIC